MIDEYFSLGISSEGLVETIPLLLPKYTPNLDRLPHFLLCLGTQVCSPPQSFLFGADNQVNWEDEKECFQAFLRELAFFYSPRPAFDVDSEEQDEPVETEEEASHHAWQIQHVLFPSFRRYTSWPKELIGKEVNQIANLPDLFRIFERC